MLRRVDLRWGDQGGPSWDGDILVSLKEMKGVISGGKGKNIPDREPANPKTLKWDMPGALREQQRGQGGWNQVSGGRAVRDGGGCARG